MRLKKIRFGEDKKQDRFLYRVDTSIGHWPLIMRWVDVITLENKSRSKFTYICPSFRFGLGKPGLAVFLLSIKEQGKPDLAGPNPAWALDYCFVEGTRAIVDMQPPNNKNGQKVLSRNSKMQASLGRFLN